MRARFPPRRKALPRQYRTSLGHTSFRCVTWLCHLVVSLGSILSRAKGNHMARTYSQALRHFVALSALLLAAAPSALPAEADAVAISRNIQARHLPFGTVLDPVFASPTSNQIVGYSRCGDSAIWTGYFLAAEAYRYKVTGSAEALANVKQAVAGIKSLSDITGSNVLARCVVPLTSPYGDSIRMEEQHNGIYVNSSAQEFWVGHTSRDQYAGVFFGLSIAFDMVDDAGVRSSIKDEVTLLLDYLRGHGWSVFMPNEFIPSTTFLGRADQQLSFLQVGRHVNPDRYSTSGYDSDKASLAPQVIIPIGLEVTSDTSYFKFNLDTINLFDLLRLEGSGTYNGVYKSAYDVLRNHTRDQKNAFFNMIDRALNGPDPVRDAETVTMLEDWLKRPRRDVSVDLRGKLPSCNDPNQACSPVPVALRPSTDFLWQRDPYNLSGGGAGTIEGAGLDYSLPYWMARFYGVIKASGAASAASGSAVLSAESIASYYGSNLTTAIASAATLPLPLTLGAVSLQVKDSTGAVRLAPLFYVSPGQINFEVPPGTATGPVTLTVVNSTGATVDTSTASVNTIAPALFTADASGKGVAAALAIRVTLPGGQQSSSPIFQCANGVCSSVPINLGVDTPTYLSLYGTGIRNRSTPDKVQVTVHGISVPVQAAQAQGSFVGLDQVNVQLPLSLRGSGESDLVLTVDGVPANTVRVNIL